jgi:hypothetical protein
MFKAEILIVAGAVGRGALAMRVRRAKFACLTAVRMRAMPLRPANAAVKSVKGLPRIHNSPWRKTADMGIQSLWKKALHISKWKRC